MAILSIMICWDSNISTDGLFKTNNVYTTAVKTVCQLQSVLSASMRNTVGRELSDREPGVGVTELTWSTNRLPPKATYIFSAAIGHNCWRSQSEIVFSITGWTGDCETRVKTWGNRLEHMATWIYVCSNWVSAFYQPTSREVTTTGISGF